MSWDLFDGNEFEEAYQVAGEWIVRVRRQPVTIRITVDRNGEYYYRNSPWPQAGQGKRPPTVRRGFTTIEQALAQAVKDIKTTLGSERGR